ncbi:ROK family protein [bacterium]|nr:ROK family protein [bacterium]
MYLGIEIGGTNLRLGVGDGRTGRLREWEQARVQRAGGARGILATLSHLAPPLLKRYPVRAVGIGFGGPVDTRHGRVVKSHQIGGWNGVALGRWCTRRFRVPTVIENDSNVAGLAEARFGAGRGRGRVFYFNVGTGIGGAFILDGEICQGHGGGAELGHTRMMVGGRAGSRPSRRHCPTLETVAGGLAIEQGRSTVAESAAWVGLAVANVIAVLNPEVIVAGGGVARTGARFFRPLRATVKQLVFAPYRPNYRIRPAALGATVVLAGAVLLAAERFPRGR